MKLIDKLKQKRLKLLFELDQLPKCEHHYGNNTEPKTIDKDCDICRAKHEIGKRLDKNLLEMRKVKGVEVLNGNQKVSSNLKQKLMIARENGLEVKDIAQKFNVSTTTVRRHTKKQKELIV